MKKLIVGIPTSLILMMSSCTATLQEFQDRSNGDDTEEVSDNDDSTEEVVEDTEEELPEDDDSETDEDTSSNDNESEESNDEEDSTDEEEDETEDEETEDNDTVNEEQVIDEPLTLDDLPEEVIQEFVRLNERTESLENRLNNLERHLNEAEDEISRLYDSLGNRVSSSSDDEEETEVDEREDVEVFDTSDGRGSRSEPFDVGDTVAIEVFEYSNGFNRVFGTAEITIDNIVVGEEADEILQEESRFNEDAPDGYEWAVISMTFYLASFEDEDMSIGVTDSISIVSENGSSVPNEYALPPRPLTYTEVYSGGEVSGNVAKLVPQDEPFLIYFDTFKAEDLFFLYDGENISSLDEQDSESEEEVDQDENEEENNETEEDNNEEDNEEEENSEEDNSDTEEDSEEE